MSKTIHHDKILIPIMDDVGTWNLELSFNSIPDKVVFNIPEGRNGFSLDLVALQYIENQLAERK